MLAINVFYVVSVHIIVNFNSCDRPISAHAYKFAKRGGDSAI